MKKEERKRHGRKPVTKKATYEIKVMRYSRNLGTELSSVQHTALMLLCQYRHRLHAVSERYSTLPESEKDKLRGFFLNKANTLLLSAGLPELAIRFFPIDQLKDDAQREKYIDELNIQIEAYLSAMDKRYGTMYCPTGYRRRKRVQKSVALKI